MIVNFRTGLIHFEIIYSEPFENHGLESLAIEAFFTNMKSLMVGLVSDSELSLVKLAKSQSSKPVNFHVSKHARDLEKRYTIKFIIHPSHHAMFSAKS